MTDRIYLIRHGYRLNWVSNDWKSPTGLARDPPLAAFGERQAEELAQYFLSLPESERHTAIFSSPFYRCLQTSKPVSQALGIPIFAEHGLSEWYSPVKAGTGLHPRPAPATELRSYFQEVDPSWSSVWIPSRKGELVEEVHDRAGDVLETLLHTIPQRLGNSHKRIILVSHAATIIALARELLGDRSLPLRVGCCTITEVAREEGRTDVRGAWQPLRLANGDHLADGSSRDWGFEDIQIANGQVVEDDGVPGTELEKDEPVGRQSQPDAIPSARM